MLDNTLDYAIFVIAPLLAIVVVGLLTISGGVVTEMFNVVSESLGFDEARRRRIMRRWRRRLRP